MHGGSGDGEGGSSVKGQGRFIVNPTICKDSMKVQEGTEKAQKLHQSSANKIERRLQN